jgi:TorA maturation chaperone TorD
MEIKKQSHNILKGYNMLLYFAGSMVMYEPNEECIVDFWQQGIIKKLPVASTNPNFALAAAQLSSSCNDKALCLKGLKEDYLRLFDGHGLPLAPAYESIYSVKGNNGLTRNHVSEFYDSYGWISKYRGKVNDDHLGVELLFLTILVEKYLALDDHVCMVEMRSEIRRFIDEHILNWLGKWNLKMQEHANSLSYKGISTLIYACVEDIYSICDNNAMSTPGPEYLKN